MYPLAPGCRDIDKLTAWLIEKCGGAYVADHIHCQTGAVQILVDPSGLLPVYCAETATHRIFASHPELLRRASGVQLVPSWPAIHAHLSRPDLRQRGTCLAGVSELTPGNLIFAGGRHVSRRQLWQPDDFMPSTAQISSEELAEQLRELATSVISAWAMRLGRVAVAESGGVDSSLICAALAKARQPFACVTLATADPSGDERTYVWMIGDHLGVTQATAIDFVDQIIDKFPFQIREIRTDNGHEFQAKFHWHVEHLGIRHAYIKRGTPRPNGKVERSHRSDQQEF